MINKWALKIFLAFIFFNGCVGFLYANQVTDSLLKELSRSRHDTVKAKIFAGLCVEFADISTQLSYKYGVQGTYLSYLKNDKNGMAYNLNALGNLLYKTGKYNLALKFFYAASYINIELNHKSDLGSSYHNIGTVYLCLDDYNKALYFFNKALTIKIEIKDYEGMAYSLNNLGVIHHTLGNYVECLKYYQKALYINDALNNPSGIATNLVNIGNLFAEKGEPAIAEKYYKKACKIQLSLGNMTEIAYGMASLAYVFTSKGQNLEALQYLKRALEISEEMNNDNFSANCYLNIGTLTGQLGNSVQAEKYYEKALVMFLKCNDKDGKAKTYVNLAKLFLKNNNAEKAFYYADKSLKISEEIHALKNINETTEILTEISAKTGRLKDAYNYFKYFKQTNDSIFNIEADKQLKELEAKFENERQQKEIHLLNEKNKNKAILIRQSRTKRQIQALLFIAGIVFLGGTVYVLIKRNTNKQKLKLAVATAKMERLRFKEVVDARENERKMIASSLYNSVGNLLNEAKHSLSAFDISNATLSFDDNEILENAKSLINQSGKDILNISQNLVPEILINQGLIPALYDLCKKAEIPGKISAVFKTNIDNIHMSDVFGISVYRILQEILSNTLKYSQAGEIEIILTGYKENLLLKITDNGKGFDTSAIQHSEGIGWKNIYSRTELLNGNIRIVSGVSGTTVLVDIPRKSEFIENIPAS